MIDGRTVWWAKDSAWWRRDRIVELGERFGAAGPAVIDWLACEAKVQNAAGKVKAGYRALARGAFLENVTVAEEIVRAAADIGALDELEHGDRTFTCRVSGWRSDQDAWARWMSREHANARQQRYRDRQRHMASPGVTSDGG